MAETDGSRSGGGIGIVRVGDSQELVVSKSYESPQVLLFTEDHNSLNDSERHDSNEHDESKSLSRPSLVVGQFLPNQKLVASCKSKSMKMGIDEETRNILKVAEYYHYLTIQNRWNTIVSFLISIFEIGVCILCFMCMDYHNMAIKWKIKFKPSPFLLQFAFACDPTKDHFWNMEDDSNPGFPRMRAETNFTFHIIFIYLYSTLQLVVLSTIPYRYDRFIKTDKQKQIDKEKAIEDVAFLKFKLKQEKLRSQSTEFTMGDFRSFSAVAKTKAGLS